MALDILWQRATKEQCSLIVKTLSRQAGYAAEWDAILRRSVAVPVEILPSNIPVAE